MNKYSATAIGKIEINIIDWYVPHYTPSIDQERFLRKQIVYKIPTELQYVERSKFMKELNTQKLWTSELGIQEQIKVPICIIVRFQQKERQDSENLANDSFYRHPVASCQCIIGTEKNTDNAILLNYNIDGYSQGYGQIKEVLKALTKKRSTSTIFT